MKALVGMSPTGVVTFVSDAYRSSFSDRSVFGKCGIIDKVRENYTVLVDHGFQIQDLPSLMVLSDGTLLKKNA